MLCSAAPELRAAEYILSDASSTYSVNFNIIRNIFFCACCAVLYCAVLCSAMFSKNLLKLLLLYTCS